MRINLGTTVVTSDGKDIGKIDRLVVDPRSERMQEFVVRKGFFVQHDVIIPIGEVEDRPGNDDEDKIHLKMSSEDVEKLPEFEESAYMYPPVGMYPGVFGDAVPMSGAGTGGVLWPSPIYEPADQGALGRAGLPAVPPGTMGQALEQSRPNDVFLTTGTDVKGRDGDKIGTVDELVVDPERGKVTELIVKQGLFGGKEIRIPTQFIEEIDDDAVHVALSKDQLDRFTVDH